jgi:hypothetical protein
MTARTKAARTTAWKAGQAAVEARSNPYVQRLIEDPDLRDNVRAAYDHALAAYRRMSNGKPATKALMEDKKLQRELRDASSSLRTAADQIRGKQRKRKHRIRRLMMLLLIGGGLAMAFSEGARKAVLDKLFGAEEEFEYSSTTTPA